MSRFALSALALPAIAAAPCTLQAQDRDTVTLAEIRVVGSAERIRLIPGSATEVGPDALRLWRPLTVNESLRRVPGLVARDEEGFGLRPNIGVRGLNPTRSTKVLLLEDGVPLTFAPYGDNASYYHPPVERFERIEVLKGSGQIMFGPQTVGGVINYVTPSVPAVPGGTLTVGAGSRDLLNLSARVGGTTGRAGALLGVMRRQGEGARANTGSRLEDVYLKSRVSLGARQALTLRANGYRERSNVTYSGLTESEWAADPRANPFVNDSMLLDRWGLSLTHELGLAGGATLTTTAYGSGVSRDWWRQASNSGERPNDRSDPTCGGMQNLTTTCGVQGRLRDYVMFGVEPRLRSILVVGGAPVVVDAGLRAHVERQRRRQVNAATPTGRTAGPASNVNSGIPEDNRRDNAAFAAFAQTRVERGAWAVTPGVRVEHVRYARTNRVPDPDVSGRTDLTQLVPGVGVTYNPSRRVSLFAGVHRGFAPPRTEDVINNTTGGVVELDAELSWNWETGLRLAAAGWSLEATAFLMDFANQIVPASVAGGAGATLTNAGATRHAGLELAGRWDVVRGAGHRVALQGSLSWLPVAEYAATRLVFVGTGGGDVAGKIYAAQNGAGSRTVVDVAGNRLPYAPAVTATASLGYARGGAFDARLEAVRVGRQFADALNAAATIPDGQQGVLPATTLWNAAATWTVLHRSAVFVAAQNLFDALYVADRTRGLLPGAGRTVQLGISQGF